MRALVIGADGFAGRWLLRHLAESGDEITAAVGPGYGGAALPGELAPHPLDVRDANAVRTLIVATAPQAIYYLAGVSQPGARDEGGTAISVSVIGAAHALAAAAELEQRPRLLHAGSSHMYGAPDGDRPISEETPLGPQGVYGAAKAATESMLRHLGPAVGVDVIGIRAFNHVGPGQGTAFVVPSLAAQVAGITRGEEAPIIHLGNADVRRDFTDVRDVVRAYRLLAERGQPGEVYNVASGQAVRIGDVVELLAEISGVEVDVRIDPSLVRPEDANVVIGDAGKLRAATGWRPEIPLRQTLKDVLAEAEHAATHRAT
jgi:GDP-4-dehydro-6-deoxy-D-mannose reductase